MTHERTPLGRELLGLHRDAYEWAMCRKGSAPESAVTAAIVLAWSLYLAASHGLDFWRSKELLVKHAGHMEVEWQRLNTRGKHGTETYR